MSVVRLQNGAVKSGNSKSAEGPATQLLAALDIGSTKISCLIAQRQALKHAALDARQALKVIGFGHVAARGMHNGAVINVEEAERAIRLAVDAAEKTARQSISEVYVNVSCGRPQSLRYSGSVDVRSGTVSKHDVDAAVTAALQGLDVGKRKVMHLAPVSFSLDGASGPTAPLGLQGQCLAVEIGVVTVEPSALHNLSLAVARAHLDVAGFVLTPLAAGKAVLSEDETTLGTVVVDLGGSVTSIGVFAGGALVAADTIAMGATLITHDIAQGLSTNIAHAERMKTLFGTVLAHGHDGHEILAVPLLGETGADAVHRVPKSTLSAIILPRVEEILETVALKIAELDVPVMRVVLTGGGAALTGVKDLAQTMFGVPVRVGATAALPGLNDMLRQPGFAVATGLLCHGLKPEARFSMPVETAAAIERQQMGYARRMTRWLRDAF
jgi:cell division protein FtsA